MIMLTQIIEMLSSFYSFIVKRFSVLILLTFVLLPAFSQIDSLKVAKKDSLLVPTRLNDSTLRGRGSAKPDINLNDALKVVKAFYADTNNLKSSDEGLREAIRKLVKYIEEGPIDTTISYLKGYPFKVMTREEREQYERQLKAFVKADTSRIDEISRTDVSLDDSLLHVNKDSLLKVQVLDTNILRNDVANVPDSLNQPFVLEFDSSRYEKALVVDESFKKALDALVSYVENDSVKIWIYNIDGDSTNILLKRDAGLPQRFWLKNKILDSLGLWVEVLDRRKIQLATDRGIDFNNLRYGRNKKKYTLQQYTIDRSLRDVKLIEIEPNPWDIGGFGQLNISQVYLSNWTKGGENAIAGLFRGEINADYTKGMYRWNNYARVKFGLIGLASEGVRKNEDTWEVNSDFGIKASKKWFYSFSFNLKSQFSKGYKYPNDSIWVSNFLSPGYLYSAAGFEYKPKKTTSLLLSPFTYRSVFVIDSTFIEHTLYGIPKDRKAKNELGLYMKIQYTYSFNDDIELENRLHLFTNYNGFNKLDFDWEALLRVKLGPFFSFNFTSAFYL